MTTNTTHADLDAALRKLAQQMPRGIFSTTINEQKQPYLCIVDYGPAYTEDSGEGDVFARKGNLYLSADGALYRVVGRGTWRNVFRSGGQMGTDEEFHPEIKRLPTACAPEQFERVTAAVASAMERYRTRSANADKVAKKILGILS